MFDYNEPIQAYETDCVNLPRAVKDKLRDHREANRDRLKRNRPENIRLNDDHFIPQGSMAIGTTVQEENNAYDIDDGAWFHKDDLKKKDGTAFTARETQEMVRDALKDPNFNKQPEIHNNCIRVFYAEGHHVDVPCYRKVDADTDKERQELAGANGFAASDPTEINRWFEERVQALNKVRDGAGSQLRVLIRLMKRFARSRGDDWDMPNGIKLTMLVEECFPTYYTRDDEAFYWLLSKLKTRLAVSLEVENRAQTKVPKDKLTKSPNDANMVELRTRVGEALDKLGILHRSDCTRKEARAAWDWVFQSDGYFDAYDKDNAKARALFTKAALVNAGLAATDGSGVIVRAAIGVEMPNLAHKFYGDDSDKQG
ncbi:MAG: cyclic GMP-AMP synthase DncV-like nucleotidyltransferase [Verrucomicrobiota bacterium]